MAGGDFKHSKLHAKIVYTDIWHYSYYLTCFKGQNFVHNDTLQVNTHKSPILHNFGEGKNNSQQNNTV